MGEEEVFQYPIYAWVLGASTLCWMIFAVTLIIIRPGPLGEADDENALGIWRLKLFVMSYFGSFVLALPTLLIFPTVFDKFLTENPQHDVPVLSDILTLVPAITFFACGTMGCLMAITVVQPKTFLNSGKESV